MPKVPKRPLSPGEIHKTFITSTESFHGTKNFPTIVIGQDYARSKHGAVKTIRPADSPLPHPFKCSKCEYTATDKADFNDHWSLEH